MSIEWIIDDDFLDEETKLSADGQGYLKKLVRCKDCEHGQSYNMFGSRYCLKHNDVAVKDNDYCSYGERADT